MVLALKYLLFSKIFWPGWTLSNCEDQPRVAKVQTMAYGGLFGWSLCKTNVTSKPIITRIFIKWIEWKVKENTCEVNYRKHKKTRATRFPWWILVGIWLVDSTMLVFFTNYRWGRIKTNAIHYNFSHWAESFSLSDNCDPFFLIQQLKDKLTNSYLKLSNYITPLYMAYSYEEAHGPQYTVLASVLKETSFFLNSTVSTLRHEVIFSLILSIQEGIPLIINNLLTSTYSSDYCTQKPRIF